MEKYKIDERTGWEYELQGDYYYPTGRVLRGGAMIPEDISKDDELKKEMPIGIWGQRHLRYISMEKSDEKHPHHLLWNK